MKIWICAFILGAIIYIGIGLKQFYKTRKKMLNDAILFCDILSANMDFIKMPLIEILEKNSQRFTSQFQKILTEFVSTIESGGTAVQSIYLRQHEAEILNNLFSGLGKTDLSGQQSLIAAVRAQLSALIEDAGRDCEQKADMSFKLSVCFGLMFFIIFI